MKTTIVTTAELAAHPEWRVFDCRHDLGQPGLGGELYRAGHIPGAVHANLDADLSGPKNGRNGRHPLPDPERFAAWLGAQGLTGADQVVAYDAAGTSYAARLWWMLRWMGHRAVAVLDGGFDQWAREGRPITAEVPSFASTRYVARPDRSMAVDVERVARTLERHDALVIDARAAARYAGANETIDPVAGHIPGARNRPYTDNLDANGCFRPAADLRAEFTGLLKGTAPDAAIHQCGSGVTACHNLLAMEIGGLTGSKLYPGSWSEWCSDPSRPVARGPEPGS